ncbi:MFS monosaccharide transporter [Lasiodiplodia theobromae]|uniref:MFS monosaccharide transporter n=1 Tax=Lasiodiplodia theobromae TaxID=45133 RepID=UPI0015C303B3|nr:MFS monosaccharide transporter [Lasiodiplodia theobromae]KAF4546292.1 MFS monosaccharide transporter [Lasiodiplodia theobromae]
MATAKEETLWSHRKMLCACFLITMCPFQYGLDFGLIGGLQAMPGFLAVFGHKDPTVPMGYNISTSRQQLISSLMTLGAFISSSSAGPVASIMGRKAAIWAACVTCICSNVIMMATTSIGGLYAGRFILGLANGVFMTFSQLYLQESTPARYRGVMLAVFQWWTSIGSLVGNVVDNFTAPLPGKESYMIPLGLIYILPCFMFVGLFFIPESPRWLLQHGQREKAHRSLLWLRPDKEMADKEIVEIEEALRTEQMLATGTAIHDLWRNPVDRRRTVLAVCAISTQAASGAMYMIAYGTYFFEMAHIGDAFRNSCILTGVGVVAIVINTFVISRFGRRRVFLMAGMFLCGATQLIIAVVYTVKPGTVQTGKVIVGLSVVYIVGYNGMVATYAWLSGGEIPSQRLRSYTFGIASSLGFLGAWLATFTAPYFINPDSLNWGPRYGYIWAPPCFLTVIWVYFFLPEVKNRTLEEIDEMFEMRLPARKFRKYVCTGRVNDDRSSSKVSVERIEDMNSNEKTTAEATVSAK